MRFALSGAVNPGAAQVSAVLWEGAADTAAAHGGTAVTDTDADGFISMAELKQSHVKAATELPNLAIPEMDGIGAQEICVTTAMKVCYFISAMDTDRTP